MENDFNFKKVFGVIPASLYDELVRRNKFNSDWDSWLSKAISKALEGEE